MRQVHDTDHDTADLHAHLREICRRVAMQMWKFTGCHEPLQSAGYMSLVVRGTRQRGIHSCRPCKRV
eukprot:1099140-Amphidinium_carterae.1